MEIKLIKCDENVALYILRTFVLFLSYKSIECSTINVYIQTVYFGDFSNHQVHIFCSNNQIQKYAKSQQYFSTRFVSSSKWTSLFLCLADKSSDCLPRQRDKCLTVTARQQRLHLTPSFDHSRCCHPETTETLIIFCEREKSFRSTSMLWCPRMLIRTINLY